MKNIFVMMLCGLLLTACGGGSGGVGGGGSSSSSTISGTASQGDPIAGSVTLKDAKGATKTASINSSTGAYSIDVTGMTAPFILKAGDFYSVAGTASITNINPLTNLTVRSGAGATSIESIFTDPTLKLASIIVALPTIISNLKTALNPLYPASVPETQRDFMNGSLIIDQGVDLVLANTNISIGVGGFNIVMKDGVTTLVSVTISPSGTVTITQNKTNIATAGNNLFNFVSLIELVDGNTIKTNFDYYSTVANNDYSNNFINANDTSLFKQVASGGLSGGALEPLDTGSWGNSNAKSKYTLNNVKGAIFTSTIDFLYNGDLLNPNVYERTMSIGLNPSADWNHYIIATIEPASIFGSTTINSNTKQINIISYSWVASNWNPSNPGVSDTVTLTNGWYRFESTITNEGGTLGDQLQVKAELFSLGGNGLSSPVSLGKASGTIYDLVFALDHSINTSIYATKWGGTSLIDNFVIGRGSFVP